MADGRMLKKKISLSRRLSDLQTDTARMFYTWLLAHLDIEGRFSANPDILKGLIVPRLKHITPIKIEEIIQDMAKVDLIMLYSYDGDRYLQYRAFEDNQILRKDREKASEIHEPNDTSRITPGELQDTARITPPQVKLSKVKLSKDNVRQVIDFLNETGKRNFTYSNANMEYITARLNEGHTIEDCKQVITNKWKDPDFNKKYFRPQTLFRASKFEGYLNEGPEGTVQPRLVYDDQAEKERRETLDRLNAMKPEEKVTHDNKLKETVGKFLKKV